MWTGSRAAVALEVLRAVLQHGTAPNHDRVVLDRSTVSPASLLACLGSTRMTLNVLRGEVLAGLVVALALIPEAISFSIIAGVDPSVGLFASFTKDRGDHRPQRLQRQDALGAHR